MMPHTHLWKCFGVLCLAAVLSVPAWAQQATARFTPHRIYPDETATYEVMVEAGGSLGSVDLPAVKGLEIVSRSQNSAMQIINGRVSANITLAYGIRATEAGTYTMPSFRIGSATVPEAKLEVMAMTEARREELEERERLQREAQREILGMEVHLPEGPIYVGQAIPVQLTIYVRADLYAEALNRPEREGDAFTLAEFAERPAQRTAMRNGRRYQEFIWENILTPLKAGTFPLRFKEAFVIGRSFFNQQQVELSSDLLEVEVLPLPERGQPVDFDGAIGSFSIERPTLDTTRLQAGEPLTMRVTITGEGNFGRMGPPVLRDSEGWRVYPPEDSFRKEDTLGYRGVKTYAYVLIPRSEKVTQSPSVAFSFFEPEAGEYVELRPESLPVEVLPAPPGSRPMVEPRRSGSQSRGPSLLPNRMQLGTTVGAIRPIFFNPLFLAGQSIPLAVIAGLLLWRWQRLRLETDSAYARARRARREVGRRLAAAEKAARAGNASAFYEESMRAIQEAVAPRLKREPESLTLLEVEAYLAGEGLGGEPLQSVRVCFEAGDAFRFGGLSAGHVDIMTEWSQIKGVLAKLEGGRK